MTHTIRIIVASLIVAAPASAQDAPPPTPSIQVIGVGTVKTSPDVARLSFDLRGEGATADKATQALVNKQKAIVDALTALAGTSPIAIHTSDMKIEAARSPDCKGGDRFDGGPQLSAGDCAITGYVASESVDVRTKDIKDAGTFVGLAGRLGADNASIDGYEVEDTAAARQAATAKALADARGQATAIALGSGANLGALISVRNQDVEPVMYDMIATAARNAPPAVAAPPIVVTALPTPIDTAVRLAVTYAIGK